ncbi:hypothetical protein diail_6775 [Diaporthe ilicicola]|nr:hypothetical protein diail_6775 [Diaporthe ilicicola]
MTSIRALRLTSLVSGPGLFKVHQTKTLGQSVTPAALYQARSYAAKRDGEKEDLGGPGGGEPLDPIPMPRAEQIKGFRNVTIAGMIIAISVPVFYMVGKPRMIAEMAIDADSAGPFVKNDPAEKLAKVQGGMPGGRKEQRKQWEGNSGQDSKAVR